MSRLLSRSSIALTTLALACTLACNGSSSDDADTETTEEESESNFDDGTGLPEGDCADVCGTPNCGTCPGETPMVAGAGFNVEAYEVTNAQYAALLEVEFSAEAVPSGCDWKSGFEPDDWDLSPADDLPVVGVDWCDAALYCEWIGKRLCGAIGGGPANPDDADDPNTDEWFSACSDAGALAFPYGADYDAAACNGADSGNDALLPGGSLATCEGGIAGVFDMSGNVWEWTNACDAAGGDANTECRRRGGGRFSDPDSMRCAVNSLRPRGTRDNATGIRCCSD